MKFYNSLTRKKELFTSLIPGVVGMYVCGPTVYDVGHLGHARSAVAFDVVRRYLTYKGYSVTFVSNFTDIDDKIIKRAAELGITEHDLVEKIIPEYEVDYARLGIIPPTHRPRATDPRYLKDMVNLVERLISMGAAYKTDDGIYFSVKTFSGYGKLSHQKLEDLQAGARITVDEKKESAEDFVLWKKEKPEEPSWEGPAGMRGRPGWHIECSAMSEHLLGKTFDIHGGGIDLIFPHHEGEVAQSEKANGEIFARYWLHNGHVQINKEKMSKSLGNFFTIKDILSKYHPQVVRFFLVSTHYRMPIEFSDELLDQARNALTRLQDCYRAVQRISKSSVEYKHEATIQNDLNASMKAFEDAMDDDLEIARALAAVADMIVKINSSLGSMSAQDALYLIEEFFQRVDSVLGGIIPEETNLDGEILLLIEERTKARLERDFAKSDEIRKKLDSMGVIVEDTPQGTVWKRAL